MYNMQSTWLFLLHQNQHLHSSRAWSPRLRRIPRGPRKSLCLLEVATWNLDHGHWSWLIFFFIGNYLWSNLMEYDGIGLNWLNGLNGEVEPDCGGNFSMGFIEWFNESLGFSGILLEWTIGVWVLACKTPLMAYLVAPGRCRWFRRFLAAVLVS